MCAICPGIGTCSCSTFPRLRYIFVFHLSWYWYMLVFHFPPVEVHLCVPFVPYGSLLHIPGVPLEPLVFHLSRLFYISCAPVVPVVVHLCAPLVRLWYIFVLHLSGMEACSLVLVFCLSGCTVCVSHFFLLYKDYRFWCFTCFVIIYFIGWVTYACSPLCPFNSLYFHSLVC